MRTALLDVNLLTALFWSPHVHHGAAHEWFGRRRRRGSWATSPLTQLGVVRVLSNPAVSSDALTPSQALSLLESNLADAVHEFWTDAIGVPTAMVSTRAGLQGHQQLTDAYLLALAAHNHGVLATFDRGLRTLAGGKSELIEIVPTHG